MPLARTLHFLFDMPPVGCQGDSGRVNSSPNLFLSRKAQMKNVFPDARRPRSLGEWANDVNTLVESLMGSVTQPGPVAPSNGGVVFSPKMDVREAADRYVVSLDLPGVARENTEIELTEDQLVIRGTRSSEKQLEGDRYHRIERSFGEFRRALRLPQDVHRDGISAEYADGVLTVSLPKEAPKPTVRKIEIGGSGPSGTVEAGHPRA